MHLRFFFSSKAKNGFCSAAVYVCNILKKLHRFESRVVRILNWRFHLNFFTSNPGLYYLSCCSLLSVLCCLRLSSSSTFFAVFFVFFFVVFFLFFIVTFSSSSTLSTTVKTMVQHTGDSPSSLCAVEKRYKRERSARLASRIYFRKRMINLWFLKITWKYLRCLTYN